MGEERLMVKPRFPGHVEAPSATRRATDKWAHDTMRPEQLDSGSTHTSQPQEGCALLHPLQGVSLLSTRVSKNAVFGLNFLPGFWTWQILWIVPILTGFGPHPRGPKSGHGQLADLDALSEISRSKIFA